MSSHSGSDGPGGEPARFGCEWSAAGMQAATLRVAGELDMLTAPQLEQVLQDALEHARLVMVDVGEVSFVDCSALHVLLDSARRARRRGSRLVLVGASAEFERLFAVTGTRAMVDVLPGAPAAAGVRGNAVSVMPDRPVPAGPVVRGGVDPLKNPVNAGVVTARVMDVPERGLWAQCPDGSIRRAWAPAAAGLRVPAGDRVEVFLDRRGAVNGWWHAGSGVAVNQRHLAAVDAESVTAAALACQGACGLLWQAPAAARVLDQDERCLTCAGALAVA